MPSLALPFFPEVMTVVISHQSRSTWISYESYLYVRRMPGQRRRGGEIQVPFSKSKDTSISKIKKILRAVNYTTMWV